MIAVNWVLKYVETAGPMIVADSYPLTPLQHGMLLHRIQGGNDGVDIEQMIGTLRESLDVAAFERAWGTITARHPVLRTRFRWEGVEQPLQEVLAEAAPPFQFEDLQKLSVAEQEAHLENYLTENTKFWVVRAQVSAGGVTGLDTVFSGAYIGKSRSLPPKTSHVAPSPVIRPAV